MMNRDRLTVVIPTLNESRVLGGTLERVRMALPGATVVIADGGSSDETTVIAAHFGADVIHSACGRGIQCHAGAERTASAWLLFLHADTLLPRDAAAIFTAFSAPPKNVVGTFRVQFAGGGKLINALAWVASRGDSVFTRFGDQGILIRRSFYDAIGGFPPWPLFEDVALLQRARKHGRVPWLPGVVLTSARRFNQRGFFRQRLLNAHLMLRYLAGASPMELATRYERRSKRTAGAATLPSERD